MSLAQSTASLVISAFLAFGAFTHGAAAGEKITNKTFNHGNTHWAQTSDSFKLHEKSIKGLIDLSKKDEEEYSEAEYAEGGGDEEAEDLDKLPDEEVKDTSEVASYEKKSDMEESVSSESKAEPNTENTTESVSESLTESMGNNYDYYSGIC